MSRVWTASLPRLGRLPSRVEHRPPWRCAVPAGEAPSFHLVVEGRATLWLEAAVDLGAGDLVVLPSGAAHHLGGAERCVRLSGTFDGDAWPLPAQLPPVVHLPAGDSDATEYVRLVLREIATRAPGCEAVVSRLLECVLVQVLRDWVAVQPNADVWGPALREPQISAALHLVHDAPAERWSVEALARRVGMSRSVFAARFREVVGHPPAAYLARWRMTLAARLLRTTDLPLAEIAQRAGYESEFSFNRAFKRERGVTPGRYRSSA